MKKLLILICLLASATRALPASAIWLFGGGMGYTNQNTAAMHPWSATSIGVMEQSYFDVSETLGVFTAATLGFMVNSQDNGAALDIGQYQAFAVNVLLGIGLRIPLTPALTTIGGAGIYMGSAMLTASNQTLSSYYAGGFGAGIGLSLMYSLSINWGIGVNINAAYSFANPGDAAPTMAANGVHLFGGIGVTWFSYPVIANPRYSRFAAAPTMR
jgi:hypothetical protein